MEEEDRAELDFDGGGAHGGGEDGWCSLWWCSVVTVEEEQVMGAHGHDGGARWEVTSGDLGQWRAGQRGWRAK